jgi:GNAT superfamily N-acetyltransferase
VPVVEMCLRFFASSVYSYLGTPDEERVSILFDLSNKLGICLVADGGAQLWGFIAFVALDHPISGELYAAEQAWWVEPAARRGRVGPKLLHAAEEWCRSRSIHMIQMVAPLELNGSCPVGDYYQVMGYRALETAFFKRL